jgi:hypothetical protein
MAQGGDVKENKAEGEIQSQPSNVAAASGTGN